MHPLWALLGPSEATTDEIIIENTSTENPLTKVQEWHCHVRASQKVGIFKN